MASEKDGIGKNLDLNSDVGPVQLYRTIDSAGKPIMTICQKDEGLGLQAIWIPMTPENKKKLFEAWESLED